MLWGVMIGIGPLGCVDDRPPEPERGDAAVRDARPVLADRAPPDAAPDVTPDAIPDAAPDVGCRPAPEQCNGQDDDCDETIDEDPDGAGAACAFPLPGACAVGAQACVGGDLQCMQAVVPADEICDEADNDCDGAADEGLGGDACDTGALGACADGVMRCGEGQLRCVALAEAVAESCTGSDDDCDGAIDEDDGAGDPCVGCVDDLPDVQTMVVCGGGGPVNQVGLGECAVEAELHIVGQYEPTAARTTVTVTRFGVPLVLVLSAYEPTEWVVELDPRVTVEQVIVNGYEPSVVMGLPPEIEVVDRTRPGNYLSACAYAWPGDDQGCDTQGLVRGVEALTGLTLTSFQGCYSGTAFTLATAPR